MTLATGQVSAAAIARTPPWRTCVVDSSSIPESASTLATGRTRQLGPCQRAARAFPTHGPITHRHCRWLGVPVPIPATDQSDHQIAQQCEHPARPLKSPVPTPGPASNLVHPRRTAGSVASTCRAGSRAASAPHGTTDTHEQLGPDPFALLKQQGENR
jgi:hypothetical protein